MPDYHSNSHKAKASVQPKEEKKIERITSSQVVVQKRGPWKTFKSLIIEADMGSVGRFVWLDIVVPGIKNMLVHTVEQGINRTVYGDRTASFRHMPSTIVGASQRSSIVTHVPYNRQSITGHPYNDPRGMPALPAGRSSAGSARGYIIVDREEAQQVLTTMAAVIDTYDRVSVADLHEMIGQEVTPIDHRWGWVDLREAQIRGIRDGWVLELPQPIEIVG